jgi:phosphatidylserine/phosphatidylglycerophosphate/cardiolipin synthase-like enzyme
MIGRSWLAVGVASMMIIQAQTVVAADQQLRVSPMDAVANARVEAFFTPGDDSIGKIVSAIGKAKQDIRVQAYLFTSRKLANALIRAHRAGITVEVLVDREQLEKQGAPAAIEIAKANVPVYVDGQHAAAHNKIILIDTATEAPVVITGSYNFTVAAQFRNAENLLIIHGDRQIAAAYRRNWDSHREHSVRMQ